MPLPKLLPLLALLLLTAPLAAPAQSRPAPRPDLSLPTRQQQYFLDLAQRLRAVYQAPSDGRALSLLSNLITEFSARKKALLAESKAPPVPAPAELQAVLTGPDARRMPARRQRNPALEYAFRRFDQAQLLTLAPYQPPAAEE